MQNSADLSIQKGRKLFRAVKWLPASLYQGLFRSSSEPTDALIAIANHFEPYIQPGLPNSPLPLDRQLTRVRDWVETFEKAFEKVRDSCGSRFKHTYFYPGEHYHSEILSVLADHCARGRGEIEIHLHHGTISPDTPDGVRDKLLTFRAQLLSHGCLSILDGVGAPRYAFVHGNFALANSGKGYCGVDSELQVLADTGCYADFTLPSWPNPAQIAKINKIYECHPPLGRRAAHKHGRDLVRNSRPTLLPLIVEGPLLLDFSRWNGIFPFIENSAITAVNPPTLCRFRLWMNAKVGIQGQANWIFIKLHCHGMDPRDTSTLLGPTMFNFLNDILELAKQESIRIHFVTAREMANIIFSACDARCGSPENFRDYRLRLIC